MMGRAVLGLIAGIAVTFATILALEAAGHAAFPPPKGGTRDPEALKSAMGSIALGAKITVILGWMVGAFVGAATALAVARGPVWPAWTVAGFVIAGGVTTMIMLPHPLWMQVTGILGPAVSAGLAQRLVKRAPKARG
jgi:hypothetical protein